MTLIEDDDDMAIKYFMPDIFTHESIELLNSRDNDTSIRIFELFPELCSARIAIGRSFLELIIFEHGLIIEILSIHDKEYLLYI